MAQVFISYSRKDLAFVTQLAADLKNAGFDVWYDVSRLGGGSRWRTEIENALRNSPFVIFVLSPDSIASEWVEREFLFSNNLKRKIIPLMYRACELPLNYINLNYIDVQGDNYVRNFGELLKALSVDTATIPPTVRNPSSKRRTQYIALIGGGTIIIAALLSLSPLKDLLSPPATPTHVVTATFTMQAPTDTDAPAPTPTAVSSWQQGKIAYVVRNSDKVYFLYTRDLSTGADSQLLLSPDRPSVNRYFSPWFSADGELLVFADKYYDKTYLLDLKTSKAPTIVGSCTSPSFAPDGTQVICDANGADYFPIYDVATGREIDELSHGKSSGVLPAWSPDGTEIAFSYLDENRDASIWKVSVEGGVAMPLATEATEDYAPAWSPDGEWIAYQSTQTSEQSEVWIMRRDGSDKQQITFSGGAALWSRGPCFSPDGKWLAFVSNQKKTDGSDFGDVFVVSLLTGEIQQITDTGGYVLDWRVTWAP